VKMASTSHVKAAANQQLGHLCSLRWSNSSKYTAVDTVNNWFNQWTPPTLVYRMSTV